MPPCAFIHPPFPRRPGGGSECVPYTVADLRPSPAWESGGVSAYLDHAAATPMRPEARDAWVAAVGELANPSSIHGAGQHARRVLEDAREVIARVVDADPIEVVFTSGGTESINLALKGAWWSRPADRDVIVLPDGEHHATMDSVEWLRSEQGARVRPVPLNSEGRIEPAAFGAALGPDVVISTALLANNEVGTLNPVAELGAVAQDAGVPLHIDAVAGFGHLPLSFAQLRGEGGAGIVAMSVSAHKIGGPPATGALVVSRSARLAALHHGGAAQRDLRAGTQDVAGAVAFAAAAEAMAAGREAEAAHDAALRERLRRGILAAVPEAQVLGAQERLPGNLHLLFPGASGESLLYLLDRAGIAVSTGSACTAGIAEPSHVVRAMGRDERDARSVLRFSVGRTSTAEDVDAVIANIGSAYAAATGAARRS
jgi:cysteine desulfurase